jgi:hypothetical protein
VPEDGPRTETCSAVKINVEKPTILKLRRRKTL